ncbi:MAG: RNA 2',3'-cyclic phosphodiesterase [Alphaproteobacteria bacterium]|nr:RNA 2',3'-cyclic phosphodiesterase [Alphaproteobacteria bacterium]
MSADEDGLIRLFVGLPLPHDGAVKMSQAARGVAGLQAVAADDLHITLRYLGDVERTRLDAVDDALARVRKKPFTVGVAGCGVFEQAEEDILYARIESVRQVTDLCALVTDRLGALDFDFGPRPFVPHITLGRARPASWSPKSLKIIDKSMRYSWVAEAFMLYESGGAGRYRVRAVYPLRS